MGIYSSYPGSIGELVQGKIGEMDVLISCPINMYTRVNLFETQYPKEKFRFRKSSLLLANILKKWGYTSYIDVLDFNIMSEIPQGKGFASSTADLCALYSCLTLFFEKKYDEYELAHECVKIEPTDSIVFKSMTLFDYKNGRLIKNISKYIKFYILCFIGEKIVDTESFNNGLLPSQNNIEDLIHIIERGIALNNYNDIFYASTQSIIRNQHRITYDILPQVIRIKELTNGLGIIGAHSGDMIGVIYKGRIDLDKAYEILIENYKYPTINKYTISKLETVF
jgi:L-threonine kinase